MEEKIQSIDHVDIVVSHQCNMKCSFCIDKLRGVNDEMVKLEDIEQFLILIRKHTNRDLSVLLLGGEPTIVGSDYLIQIAELVRRYGFKISMSTNGVRRDTIIECMPYFDSIQITTHSDKETDFWRQYGNKINIKLAGDKSLTMEKLNHFMEYTEGDFYRRSVSMYFTPEFEELCIDERVWRFLDTLNWYRNGSYRYAFYDGVRFKKCIPGETNVIDEPIIPKLYPNGNYNKTWDNEFMDPYLGTLKQKSKTLKREK